METRCLSLAGRVECHGVCRVGNRWPGQSGPDDVGARLTTFPNVLITGHQAFFTRQALENIASVTLSNLTDLAAGVFFVRIETRDGREHVLRGVKG